MASHVGSEDDGNAANGEDTYMSEDEVGAEDGEGNIDEEPVPDSEAFACPG